MGNTIVCYYWGKGRDWEGLCTTFDIAMHGTTLEETEQILVEAVETYLEEVDRLPEQDRDQLLKRHSPWTLRLSLKVLSLMSRLKRKFGYRGFSFTLSIKTQYTGIISKKLITGT